MIFGKNKGEVVENIKRATERGEFNISVEVNDPEITQKEKRAIINKYLVKRKKMSYKAKTSVARTYVNYATWVENRDTEIVGIENVKGIKTGAIITNNHFSPMDSTIVRKFTKKVGKRKLFIVGKEKNLAMRGLFGYLMKYADIIPISSDSLNYMKKEFPSTITKKLKKKNYILIYPEQEMWYNYRKPRPPKPRRILLCN